MMLSNRVAVTRADCFQQVGPPRELDVEMPAGFVRDFLGSTDAVVGHLRPDGLLERLRAWPA
jgi:ABC-type Fe3+/spermidine/putrescine transport system ATPase subunit